MADSSKKRSGSFKKFFPNLFFGKSKDKSKDNRLKVTNSATQSNQYHDPRSVIRSDKIDDNETIYENLTTNRHKDNSYQSTDMSSAHSSSSTLVSESVRTRSKLSERTSAVEYEMRIARPQVPPKPHAVIQSSNKSPKTMSQYPDVYYHSLEKLSEKISPIDEIEIYRASQAQADPASVGAEIKRVSTKFLISPKKEAEVRTIQPTRARSLSIDRQKDEVTRIRNSDENKTISKKPYNYSAPTTPLPNYHKIPNMPTTASPYERVRKTMIEAEERRNSLSRTSLRNKSTPSPKQDYGKIPTPKPSMQRENTAHDKEKTRQRVEAFYWQKLKEMKDKEDEYYLKHSLNSSFNFEKKNACSSCNISTPVLEPRSCSLPRGSYLNQSIYSTPFIRGAPERRTDTYIKGRPTFADTEIIYRHPEILNTNSSTSHATGPMPVFQRSSLTSETGNANQPKRVSFEGNYAKMESVVKSDAEPKVARELRAVNQNNECPAKTRVSEMLKGPPRPPVRTTSVGAKSFKLVNNGRIIHLAGAVGGVYSESESGSEAGEIQRILQNNAVQGKQYIFSL